MMSSEPATGHKNLLLLMLYCVIIGCVVYVIQSGNERTIIEIKDFDERRAFDVSSADVRGIYGRKSRDEKQAAVYDMILESDPNTTFTKYEIINSYREDFLCKRHLSQQRNSNISNSTIMTNETSCKIKLDLYGRWLIVPKIVIYVIYGDIEFNFIHYLSVRSVQRFVQPDGLYVVGDPEPKGRWWERARIYVPDLKYVWWKKPTYIYGKPIPGDIYASDVTRHQILLGVSIVTSCVLEQKAMDRQGAWLSNQVSGSVTTTQSELDRVHIAMGGIYLDTDIIFLHDVLPLRSYEVTMGLIDPGSGIGNGLIMTKLGSEFINLWYKSYTTFDPIKNYFGQHSMQVPLWLSKVFPGLINVELESFYTPGWNDENKRLLFAGHYNWTRNFAIHIWKPPENIHYPDSEISVHRLNTTLGEIARFILYGKPDIIG